MKTVDLTREPPLWLHVMLFFLVFSLAVAVAALAETLQRHVAEHKMHTYMTK